MHSVHGDRRRKYLTLHGVEVCATAWYLIHGIPKSTFHSYVQRYNEGPINNTWKQGLQATADWNSSGHGYYCCYREGERRLDAPPNARNRSWKSGHFEISSCWQQLEASDG